MWRNKGQIEKTCRQVTAFSKMIQNEVIFEGGVIP